MYVNGEGVEQNYSKAFEWWEKAAERGNLEDLYNLAATYANKQSVEQDYIKTFEWLMKAAESGNAEARKIFESLLQKTCE
ncbi:MAG: sel1 repeat family protein [Spirochaetales bacterium]|nr:sel1 repeat family protein [Spirochaetales bacterium]